MAILFSPSFFYICMHTKSTTQYITPRESTLLVTQSLMVLSPSKRLSFHPQSNSGYGNGNICSVSSLVSILKVSNPIYWGQKKLTSLNLRKTKWFDPLLVQRTQMNSKTLMKVVRNWFTIQTEYFLWFCHYGHPQPFPPPKASTTASIPHKDIC